MPEEKAAAGRRRILDQALILFLAHGYHGVSVRDIVRACGLSNAVLYYHFGSKRNLYFEVLREHITTLTGRLRDAGAIRGSCRERLANMARAYAQMIVEYHDTAEILLRDLAQFDRDEVLQMLSDLQTQAPSGVAAVLEEAMSCGEVRSLDAQRVDILLLGMVSSLATRRVSQPSVTTTLDEDVDLVIEVLFEGIGPSSITLKPKGAVSA